jgi:hypothetical protein
MMIRIILAAAILAALALPVAAEPQSRTFRNEKGQEIGRSVTRGNTTTFSNEKGQQTGRAERRPDGSTNYYDERGRMIGSSRGR